MEKKKAVIIGAGPAGLTAAFELLHKTDVVPEVYEMTGDTGGLSKTKVYKGNRIDIGGHRFFSKSERVMNWWTNILPVQGAPAKDYLMLKIDDWGQSIQAPFPPGGPDPEKIDQVMLMRNRLSRIFYLRKFFDYPLSLGLQTFTNLGPIRLFRIGASYLYSRAFPVRDEKSLEDFFVNRFGWELYQTFFRDYTEKVWGVPCRDLGADWGAQRIKGLSIGKAVLDALKKMLVRDTSATQGQTETSLIRRFMYPKLGPGQMWEEVEKIIVEKGGRIIKNHTAVGAAIEDGRVTRMTVRDEKTGQVREVTGDYYFSSMSLQEFFEGLTGPDFTAAREAAQGLVYRDFITVGLLLDRLKIKNNTRIKTVNGIIPDNWIYIQETEVKLGRIQVFNNWSPYMVEDLNLVWIGLEYFCTEGDSLWNKPDDEFMRFAVDELCSIGIIDKKDVLDSTIIRMKKAYPAYFGTYNQLDRIREFNGQVENLFLIGRNGMHRYNNQDHSMLTAIESVENIRKGRKDKDNIWSVNTEQDYQEEK
jgi:protoporphyrinogen oxidase